MLFASGDWTLGILVAIVMGGYMLSAVGKVASNSTVQKGVFSWLFGR
jgi:hypothetical protein